MANSTVRKMPLSDDKRQLFGWLQPKREWFARMLLGGMVALLLSTPLAAQRIPEICRQNNGDNILKCQKTCAKACEDPEFQYAVINGKAIYEANCEKVLEIPESQRKDAPGCDSPPPPPPNMDYDECLRKVAEAFKDYKPPIPKEPGPIQDIMKLRYDPEFSCATPLKKLIGNLICARDKYRAIFMQINLIQQSGASNVDSCENIGKFSKEEFKKYANMASQIVDDASRLSKDIQALSTCKNALVELYEKSLPGKCEAIKSKFPQCNKFVQSMRKRITPYMDFIEKISVTIKEKKTTLDSLLVTLSALQSMGDDCLINSPGVTLDPDKIELDDILNGR